MANETINIEEQLNTLEETKSQLKTAIVNKGQTISDSDSFRSYVKKIEDISTLAADTADATATASDIIRGKTAYVAGNKVTGSFTNTSVTGKGSTTYIDNSSIIPLFGYIGNCDWVGETKFLNKSQIDTSVLDGHDYTICYKRFTNGQGTVFDIVDILIYPEGYGSVWAKHDTGGVRICSSVAFEVYESSVVVTSTKSLTTMTWSDFKKQSNTTMQELGRANGIHYIYNTATFRTSSGLEGSDGFEDMSNYTIPMSGIATMRSDFYVSNKDKILTVLENTELANEINLTADKIIKGNTILGVEGTGETSGGVKIFNSVAEMNASTNNKDGDIALIYGINPVEPNTTGFTANTLILPDKIPTNILSSNVKIQSVEGDNFDVTFPARYSEYGIEFNSMINGFGGSSIYVYVGTHYGATSEEYYERKYNSAISYGKYFYITGYYTDYYSHRGLPFSVTKLKVSDATSPLWEYIKFANIDTVEMYYYDGNTSEWKICSSSLSTNADNVLKDNVVLGGRGLMTGTLDLSSKKKIISTEAYSTSCYSSDQSVMTITNPDTYVSIDTTTIPEGLGDKRWLLACTSFTMGMGGTSFSSAMYILPDDKDILYHVPYQTSGRYLGNIPDRDLNDNTKLSAYKVTGMNVIKEGDIKSLTGLTVGTAISSTLSSDEKLATYFGAMGEHQLYAFATNAEIRDVNENVLIPAGPKASTTLKGQYYINIFGEKVAGTADATQEVQQQVQELQQTVSTAETIAGEIIGEG